MLFFIHNLITINLLTFKKLGGIYYISTAVRRHLLPTREENIFLKRGMYQKRFDEWNVHKKIIQRFEHDEDFYFHEREIWWCSLGTNIGIETDGKHEQFERPVLVLKKFYKDMLWVLPLTSHAHGDLFHQEIRHEFGNSWVMLTQIKTIDSKRLLRKLGTVSQKDFLRIQETLCCFITSNPA